MSSKIDTNKFRKLLLLRQQTIESVKEEGKDAAKTVELDQTRMGRLSRMDALQAQAMQQESNRRREQELQHIHSALQRIAEGEYGFCLECDEEIAEKRLEFDPAATLCIRCAHQQEQ